MSTKIRAVDGNNDWLFGKGLNDYRTNLDAVAQDIKNNLQMFLGDCFFATTIGIDWWNLLGSKDTVALNLAINKCLLGTTGVTGILQSNISLNAYRQFQVQYQVATVYSVLNGLYVYDTATL